MSFVNRMLATDAPAAVVLIRLLVGGVFLSEGIQKFLFPEALGVGRFKGIGIPAPEIMAPFVGVCETVGGALLILGLLTRFAAMFLQNEPDPVGPVRSARLTDIYLGMEWDWLFAYAGAGAGRTVGMLGFDDDPVLVPLAESLDRLLVADGFATSRRPRGDLGDVDLAELDPPAVDAAVGVGQLGGDLDAAELLDAADRLRAGQGVDRADPHRLVARGAGGKRQHGEQGSGEQADSSHPSRITTIRLAAAWVAAGTDQRPVVMRCQEKSSPAPRSTGNAGHPYEGTWTRAAHASQSFRCSAKP